MPFPAKVLRFRPGRDFLNFNPHLHVIVSDGCFLNGGDFHMVPGFVLENLE
jgi:hypothetical protein